MKTTSKALKHASPYVALALLLTIGAVRPAFAVAAQVAGGVDPGTGLQAIIAWFLAGVAGFSIVGICAVRGVHAVADGRSFMPALGQAAFGTVLTFGAGYALASY